MKIFWTALMLAGTAFGQTPVVHTGAKEQTAIIFDGQLYVLKFVDQTKVVQLNEYYLREERPEAWTKMLSNAIYFTTGTPGEMARNMEKSLLATHPDAAHELVVSPEGSEALFMCVNWAGDKQTTTEFDVFRFQKHPKGVLGYQVSLHPNQAKITPADYKALRDRWSREIQTAKFPPVFSQMPK